MQKKKENLLEKFVKKDYKNEMEQVLEGKNFDENTKSLLLEILYKIETAYKDYSKVKVGVESKEEYIEQIIGIVKNECKRIVIIRPGTEQKAILQNRTFMVNKNEILCLPIARKLLYSIAKISNKKNIIKEKYFLLNTTMSDLLNIGSNINMVEPIRDFDGWSWTTISREIESLEYNLIYQNLQILLGTKFLNNWIRTNDHLIDYFEVMENEIENHFGKKLKNRFINSIKKLSILMELKVNKEISQKIEKEKEEITQELQRLEDKKGFIEYLTQEKNNLKNKIKDIDTIINNKQILEEEYKKRNELLPAEDKIFSMKSLVDIMVREREKYLDKIEELNELLIPKKYVARKTELEKKLEYINLAYVDNLDKELKKELINFQRIFLQCLEARIEKAKEKKEITELIYQFRYYCILPFNLESSIFQVKALKERLEKAGRKLIKKANEEKIILQVSIDEDINYEILKNIFYVRVMTLEELCIRLIKEKDKYFVQIFDESAFEQKEQLNVSDRLNKKEMKIKSNKRVKLFE